MRNSILLMRPIEFEIYHLYYIMVYCRWYYSLYTVVCHSELGSAVLYTMVCYTTIKIYYN